MISNIDKIFRQNVSEPLHSTLLPTVYEHTFLKQSQDFTNSLNAVLTELNVMNCVINPSVTVFCLKYTGIYVLMVKLAYVCFRLLC